MSFEEKESWLETRERIGMQYEDVFFLRELEQVNMEQQDVVEMSRYNWDLDDESVQDLREYQHAWQVLGAGPYIHARWVKHLGRPNVVTGDLTPGDLNAIWQAFEELEEERRRALQKVENQRHTEVVASMAFISLDTPIIQIIWGVLGFGGSAALSASCQDLHSRINNIMNTAPPMQLVSLLKCVQFTFTWADLEQQLVSLCKALRKGRTGRETIWNYFVGLAAMHFVPQPLPWFLRAVSHGLREEWSAAEESGRHLPLDWIQLDTNHAHQDAMWVDFVDGNSLAPDVNGPENMWKVVVEIVQSAVADLEVDADDTLSWPS